MLGLAYALVWYRNRIGWDMEEDEKAASMNKRIGDEEKDLELETTSTPASVSESIAKDNAELNSPVPVVQSEPLEKSS